jgi:hypothetical protein
MVTSSNTLTADKVILGNGNKTVKVSNYTIASSVPANAVFTDTTDLTQMTGILPISKGGTGGTNGSVALNNDHLIGDLNDTNMDNTLTDNTVILTSSTYGFNDENKILYKRNLSSLYNYIKGKTDSVYITTDEKVKSTPTTNESDIFLTGAGVSSETTGTLRKHSALRAVVSADSATEGVVSFRLGNDIASGTAGAKTGTLRLYSPGTNYGVLRTNTLSADRTYYLPDKGGTIALMTDVPTDLSSMNGILPMTLGGTGRSWSNTGSTAGENLPPKNAIIKMYNEDNPSRMSSVATSSGAFYATGNNESP